VEDLSFEGDSEQNHQLLQQQHPQQQHQQQFTPVPISPQTESERHQRVQQDAFRREIDYQSNQHRTRTRSNQPRRLISPHARAENYYNNTTSSRRDPPEHQQQQQSITSSETTQRAGRTFFQENDARLDRPFDESTSSPPQQVEVSSPQRAVGRPSSVVSAESTIDSLEVFMQQHETHSAKTDNTSGAPFNSALSAIEEHPSLEAGSFSYSYTQFDPSLNNARRSSYLDPSLGFPPEALVSMQSSKSERDFFPKPPIKTRKDRPERLVTHTTEKQMKRSNKPLTSQSVIRSFGNDKNAHDKNAPIMVTPPTNRAISSPHTSLQSQQKSVRSPIRRRIITTATSVGTPSSMDMAQSLAHSSIDATSAASSSLAPSEAARKEAERVVQSFHSPRRVKESSNVNHSNNKSVSPSSGKGNNTPPNVDSQEQPAKPHAVDTSQSTKDPSTAEDTQSVTSEELDLTLHDLCGESSSTDDIAWRNALHVLSVQPLLASVVDGAGWTPLHVACLGSTPPPVFMTRALLYVYSKAAGKVDSGGRLPLHLVAASSGDVETMQLLIQEYPEGVYQTDALGWSPLNLMLRNFAVDITLEHCRILLGLTIPSELAQAKEPILLQRRGDHLNLGFDELGRIYARPTPVSRVAQELMHEEAFQAFPNDVQMSLRRLCQWKRKQRRISSKQGNTDIGAEEIETALSFDAETNPAALVTPTKWELPIHIIVKRGLSESRNERNSRDHEGEEGEEEDGNDREAPSSSIVAPKFIQLVRLFIAVYPEGLVARDVHGYTPLLTALLMSNMGPSKELVETLLGKRTPGYDSLPQWAQNMPLHSVSAGRYRNPAMVPCNNNQQLPLHFIAEEMAHDFDMLLTVYESYPGAIQIQDARGRTPLHILLRNYRRAPVNLDTVALLLSDRVAQTFDSEGKLPFDILADSAVNLPKEKPQLRMNASSCIISSTFDDKIFKKFFQGTIAASRKPNSRNRLESDSFLWRLRSLPPWLRRQACSASFVQELLVEELASPIKCFLILFYGALLFILIAVFRIQMQYVIESSDSTVQLPQWAFVVICGTTFGIFLGQSVFWSICASMSDFLRLCVFNVWRWIDLAAIALVAATTTMVNYGVHSSEQVLVIGTAATGMLWISAIGYIASWWYGASIFLAAVQRVRSRMC